MSYGWLPQSFLEDRIEGLLKSYNRRRYIDKDVIDKMSDDLFSTLSHSERSEAAHAYVWLHLDQQRRRLERRAASKVHISLGRKTRERAIAKGYRTDVEYQSALYHIGAKFEPLLRQQFALGDGRRIAWAVATIDDHTQRIDYMRAKVKGLESDINLHQEAISLLQSTGVSSLGELFELAVTR